MELFAKVNRALFILALLAFAIIGVVTVGMQIIGLMTGNGDLMIFARKVIFPYGVLGSTIAGFLSFISPYLASKNTKSSTEL